eukprot:CAMPEP_0119120692 /NCGR_PEP_ID=MMETSP1310-20130426/1628_1 /TAXON_ID=464262 /ORGANISM="Genus nov. species nov., Strain RCC2339" /LENGTH=977 /DNA_ID=CAMNT_0007110187 /DNA_START=155 /DNA_END=3088 /DNA_ORIENTATION=+
MDAASFSSYIGSIGLGNYEEELRNLGATMFTLDELSEADLTRIGVPLLVARKALKCIASRKTLAQLSFSSGGQVGMDSPKADTAPRAQQNPAGNRPQGQIHGVNSEHSPRGGSGIRSGRGLRRGRGNNQGRPPGGGRANNQGRPPGGGRANQGAPSPGGGRGSNRGLTYPQGRAGNMGRPSPGGRGSDNRPPTEGAPSLDTGGRNGTENRLSADCGQQSPLLYNLQYSYSEFRKESLLGSGGFGSVYKADWNGTTVALKVLLEQQMGSAIVDEFISESSLMARLQHANIVRLYGITVDPYTMVLEYMAMGSLQDLLYSEKDIQFRDRISILLDVAKGLAFLHRRNVLHLDVKSPNILLTESLTAKLGDFGLSKTRKHQTSSSNSSNSMRTSGTGSQSSTTQAFGAGAVGTWRWMPPELMENKQRRRSCDVYSFGMLAWEVWTRTLPFPDCQEAVEIIGAALRGLFPEIPTSVPPQAKKLMERCRTDPAARPDMEEIQNELQDFMASPTPEQFCTPRISEQHPGPGAQPRPRLPQRPPNVSSPTTPQPMRPNVPRVVQANPGSGDHQANPVPDAGAFHAQRAEEAIMVQWDWTKAHNLANQGLAVSPENASCKSIIALCQFYGRGCVRAKKKAVEASFSLVASTTLAKIVMSMAYSTGVPDVLSKDATRAGQLANEAAASGHAFGQYTMGVCHHLGVGVEKSDAMATMWMQRSASAGFALAQTCLGAAFATGRGVSKNHNSAIAWFRAAAEQGYAVARLNLGMMVEQGLGAPRNEEEAFRLYELAAAMFLPEAMLRLGCMLVAGRGTASNPAAAVRNFRIAAELGNVKGQCNLGWMYEHGRGVDSPDVNEALKWYRLAAGSGLAEAEFNLGVIYESGKGVERDMVQAAEYYQLAADHGNANALYNLANLYMDGQGVAKSEAKAAELYTKAANRGHAYAQCNLGWMFEYGRGVARNQAKSKMYYDLAAKQNVLPKRSEN